MKNAPTDLSGIERREGRGEGGGGRSLPLVEWVGALFNSHVRNTIGKIYRNNTRDTSREREREGERDTVDREDGRVAVGSGGIRRDALVSSCMPRRNAVDAQEADPLISYDINVLPARVYGGVVERPRQIDREVAFHDRARNRQHLPRVERIVAERELEDLWRDCATDAERKEKKRVREGFAALPSASSSAHRSDKERQEGREKKG